MKLIGSTRAFKIAYATYASWINRDMESKKPQVCSIPKVYSTYPATFDAHATLIKCSCEGHCRYSNFAPPPVYCMSQFQESKDVETLEHEKCQIKHVFQEKIDRSLDQIQASRHTHAS